MQETVAIRVTPHPLTKPMPKQPETQDEIMARMIRAMDPFQSLAQ